MSALIITLILFRTQPYVKIIESGTAFANMIINFNLFRLTYGSDLNPSLRNCQMVDRSLS